MSKTIDFIKNIDTHVYCCIYNNIILSFKKLKQFKLFMYSVYKNIRLNELNKKQMRQLKQCRKQFKKKY